MMIGARSFIYSILWAGIMSDTIPIDGGKRQVQKSIRDIKENEDKMDQIFCVGIGPEGEVRLFMSGRQYGLAVAASTLQHEFYKTLK